MNSTAALTALWEMVGADRGKPVFVNEEDLSKLPQTALEAMKAQRLIAKASPAKSVACPGCEEECAMPVYTQSDGKGATSVFVVCDKRDDTNRVAIPESKLRQWQCNLDLIASFIASSLGVRGAIKKTDNERWEIGIVSGEKRSQMLCLDMAGELSLVVGNSKAPLVEFIGFKDSSYSLDVAAIRRLVDAAKTADERYTPSNAKREANKLDTQAMYKSWQKAYRELSRKTPGMSDVWYSQQIAKNKEIAQGRDAETIRKHMKG